MDVTKTLNTDAISFNEIFKVPLPLNGEMITVTDIEIPRIQRDYAQGRMLDSVKRVRSRFLDALHRTLSTAGESILLDFVYGDVEQKGADKSNFIPIDGQQRLTTLFLLHWFAAKKEGIEQTDYAFLEHFSYATRYSSRDFCKALVAYTPDWDNILKDDKGECSLSLTIADQSWFPLDWKNDPTIQGMLVMLDAIYHKFNEVDGLWKALVEEKRIKFYCRLLSEMGLTDDLYIKMNSRGKPLTEFEHFKAEFEHTIKEQDEKLAAEFSRKIDTDWTDILFPYRGDNNIIDDEFMNYFRFISHILCYQNGLELYEDEFELKKQLYTGAHGVENLKYLESAFDCWPDNIDDFFDKFFTSYQYCSGKIKLYQDNVNLFRECCQSRNFPMGKMLMLYAIVVYRQQVDRITEEQFRRRIRIVRNLIRNSDFEIRQDQMKQLLEETYDLITEGRIPDPNVRGFNSKQKQEEVDKSDWLKANPLLAEELFHLEDHNLLYGSVRVIGLGDWRKFEKFRILFNTCDKQLIDRALLTIGDYSQKINWRTQLGVADNDKVWEELLHESSKRKGFSDTSNVLNDLLSKLPSAPQICNNELQKIIDAYICDIETNNKPKDWRYYFVKYGKYRNVGYGMYYWRDAEAEPYNVIMMKTEARLSGRNWDLYLYMIHQLFERESKLDDFAYSSEDKGLKFNGYRLEHCNNKFVLYDPQGNRKEHPISQNSEGIDLSDRVEFGLRILKEIEGFV